MTFVRNTFRVPQFRPAAMPRSIATFLTLFISSVWIAEGAETLSKKPVGRMPGEIQHFGTGRFHVNGTAKRIALSEDGKLIFIQTPSDFVVMDRETGSLVDDIRWQPGRGQIGKLASSSDGRLIAVSLTDMKSATDDRLQIVVINTRTRHRKVFRAGRFDGDVTFLKFSPDQNVLLARSTVGTLLCWDVKTGESFPIRTEKKSIDAAAFSPDSETLAIVGDGSISLSRWQTDEKPLVIRLENASEVSEMEFSPDARWLLVGRKARDGLLVIDVAQMKIASQISWLSKPAKPDRQISTVNHLAFSPDGRFVALPVFAANAVELWDLSRQSKAGSFPCWRPETVAISRDGRWLVAGGQGSKIHVFDYETHRMVNAAPDGHDDWITRLNFTADGRRLVSSSNDGSVIVWDVASGEPKARLFHGDGNRITGTALTRDASRIVTTSANDRTLRIWKQTTEQYVVAEKRQVEAVEHRTQIEFLSDEQRFLTWNAGLKLTLWDATDGKSLQVYPTEINDAKRQAGLRESLMPEAQFSEKAGRLMILSHDGALHDFDTATGKKLRVLDAVRWDGPFVFSPNGKSLVTAHFSRHNDPHLPAGREEVRVTVRDYPSLNVTHEFHVPDSRTVLMVVSPDSQNLAFTANRTQTMVDVVSLLTGRIQFQIPRIPQAVQMQFSPDGKRLATAHANSTISVWDLKKLTVDN